MKSHTCAICNGELPPSLLSDIRAGGNRPWYCGIYCFRLARDAHVGCKASGTCKDSWCAVTRYHESREASTESEEKVKSV